MPEEKLRELLARAEATKASAEAALERTARRLADSWRRIRQDQDDTRS